MKYLSDIYYALLFVHKGKNVCQFSLNSVCQLQHILYVAYKPVTSMWFDW